MKQIDNLPVSNGYINKFGLREMQYIIYIPFIETNYYNQDDGRSPNRGDIMAGGNHSSMNSWISTLKGGAANLMKNVKDASNKVMETVQTMSKADGLDISYITSRIIGKY